MNNQSLLYKIGLLIGGLIVAALVLNLATGILGVIFSLLFKFGIPLLFAYLIVRGLTRHSQQRRY
ncbi:MAG: hypothetical protein ACK5MW_09845 [Enterococcus sp.]